MDPAILCTLLAQRIPPEQFQVWGEYIHWMSEDYNTAENQAIVEDVKNNYNALEVAYLDGERKAKEGSEIKNKLTEIDLKSIRSIREWLVKQHDAPVFIREYDALAVVERAKMEK